MIKIRGNLFDELVLLYSYTTPAAWLGLGMLMSSHEYMRKSSHR
jgi:hypothetical protein